MTLPSVVSVFGVEPIRIGGNECFARELSVQLADRGWRSVLCFLCEPPLEVRRFLQLPNVSLEVVPDSFTVNAQALKSFLRIVQHHRPHILHLHFTGFVSFYPVAAKLLSVQRAFFTDQSSHPEGYVAQRAPLWKRAMVRAVNSSIAKVICVSEYNRQCFLTLDLLPENRSEVIYNSVDLPRISRGSDREAADAFRRKHAIPGERAVVVQVSWIIPEKGIVDLLQAARLVIARNRNVHFVFVGEGDYRAQYTKLAEELGISGHVTWTGLVQDPMREGVYPAADIVCQVSRWEEAFGWVIAEAMAYGRPVVATRVGGIPELIEDGKSGFLVGRGDTGVMADRILRLLSDPPLREQMGRAGRFAAETRFDLKENVSRVLTLYGLESTTQRLATRPESVPASSPRESPS